MAVVLLTLIFPMLPAAQAAETPDVNALMLSYFPSGFSALTLAYVLSPEDEYREIGDSAVLRWRSSLGEVSEFTLLGDNLRGEEVLGGSIETSWLGAGWRLERLAFRPRGEEEIHDYSVAGVDFRLEGGTLVLGEIYHHQLGARDEADLNRVAALPQLAEGRLLQLSRTVLGISASQDFLGGMERGIHGVRRRPAR